MSDEYKKFLNWCQDKWTQEYKIQKLLSKLSNDDIDFLKDQYEARLQADMVAMLEEIQSEITELPMHYDPLDVSDLIQQKIDTLKGEKNERGTQETT